MQAYAMAERPVLAEPRQMPEQRSSASVRDSSAPGAADHVLIDQLLSHLADLVVDRLMERSASPVDEANEWMDARGAAVYLGIHRDTLRKLAAERSVPVHQDGPGCKLYFRRDELDEWRRSARSPRRQLSAVA